MNKLFCTLATGVLLLVGLPAASGGTFECRGRTATIVGTDGPGSLEGTDGDDVIVARAGKDYINAKDGDDVICTGR